MKKEKKYLDYEALKKAVSVYEVLRYQSILFYFSTVLSSAASLPPSHEQS